jgi:hypothetical protein
MHNVIQRLMQRDHGHVPAVLLVRAVCKLSTTITM